MISSLIVGATVLLFVASLIFITKKPHINRTSSFMSASKGTMSVTLIPLLAWLIYVNNYKLKSSLFVTYDYLSLFVVFLALAFSFSKET